jgi:HTH-type transcriptional regulator/antitoxin HigA
MEKKELLPFKATHPGSLIKDELDYRGIKQKDFALDIDINPTMLNEIINGKRPVTPQIALLLEKTLAIKADYWLRFQSQYELDTERIKERSKRKLQLIEHWNIIKELVPVKWFRKLDIFNNDLEKDIQLVKAIYAVDNIKGLADKLGELKALEYYRKSDKLKVDKVNLLGWSKLASWQCKDIQIADYNRENLPTLKQEIKEIVFQNRNTQQNLISLLNQFGIKLIFQSNFEKTPIDGISFISDSKPAIALTLRHKRIDNLAFTLMHEIAHIDLHLFGGKQTEFINFDYKVVHRSDIEKQADIYAQQTLISEEEWKDFINNYSPHDDEDIIRFSEKYKINPYITFGRISHEMGFYGRKTSIEKEIK